MSQQINGLFSYWKLNPQEELNGRILNQLQKQVIQNELARIAELKLGIKFDPQNPVAFAQQEAEFTGQMGILQWLLANSESAEEELRTAALNSET